jgi:SAM-dependent methyltransferase
MTAARTARALGLATALAFTGACAVAQNTAAPAKAPAAPPKATYEPQVGQAGKDVVWVPTSLTLANRMLDMAKVTKDDYVIDLGSGDGRTVITAAKRGARAHGIEYNPDLVELAKRNAEKEGVTGRATFAKADIFESDFSKATVITLFLLPDLNLKLRPTLLKMKPGTRIVSNSFNMGDWEPDAVADLPEGSCDNSWCTALFWVVPANVEGTHKVAQGELTLQQTFQKVTGTLKGADGKTVNVDGKVMGEELQLTAAGKPLRGKVNGKRIELS